jgi:hypothetical protein
MNNIIHQYFKKSIEGHLILLQVDAENLKGVELIVAPDGKIEKTKRVLDEHIFEDLEEDGFEKSHALEFNLYLKGLVK